jgi:SAM-dependent methyltransferase
MHVLDLASGSGEPALQIARAVGAHGTVTATDISNGMLELARDNARAEDLSNVSFVQCDAEELPFEDESFDVVTSRMGVMFVVDLERAFAEIRRVLRRGTAAFAAWGPLEQMELFWAMLQPFRQRVDAPGPPPDAPHPFRFSRPGSLSRELRKAGFVDVRENVSDMLTPWPGSPEDAWEMFYDMAAPPFVDELPQAERDAAIAEGAKSLRRLFDGKRIDAHSSVVIASARKIH